MYVISCDVVEVLVYTNSFFMVGILPAWCRFDGWGWVPLLSLSRRQVTSMQKVLLRLVLSYPLVENMVAANVEDNNCWG